MSFASPVPVAVCLIGGSVTDCAVTEIVDTTDLARKRRFGFVVGFGLRKWRLVLW